MHRLNSQHTDEPSVTTGEPSVTTGEPPVTASDRRLSLKCNWNKFKK
jgi:hypothetical protein